MEHLLSAWPKISKQIQHAEQVLLLTDFDGTLAPIVEKPDLAEIPEGTRNLIQALSSQRRFTVGIISGRALADLKRKVNVDGIIYAGNHGFEIEGLGMSFISPISDEIKSAFQIIHRTLVSTLGVIKGVRIEDKGITLSVHYRQVDEEKVKQVEKLVESTVNGAAFRGLFKVTSGKKVYDVKPAVDWNKGKAVRLLMKKFGKDGWNNGLLPIYLGDDVTDEDAFQAIEKYGHGVTVYVGEYYSNSTALYYLRSPDEVYNFLVQLLDNTQGDHLQ